MSVSIDRIIPIFLVFSVAEGAPIFACMERKKLDFNETSRI